MAFRYLTLVEVLNLYERVIAVGGGAFGIRDLAALESAVAQPRATIDGKDLYATVAEKVGAHGYGLIQNHPFVDGNKRVGHAAMEVSLVLNGYELAAAIDDAERLILGVAAGAVPRAELVAWLEAHQVPHSMHGL